MSSAALHWAEKLSASVMHWINDHLRNRDDESSAPTLLDLYCGHGNWSRAIAETNPSLSVVGIDSQEHNIRLAREQAQSLKNIRFRTEMAEKAIAKSADVDAIIVDPPRAGLSTEVVRALTERPVSLLLYVSCHPATLAKDLQRLSETAYRVEQVQAFDMFPQTPHLESLAVLRRVG